MTAENAGVMPAMNHLSRCSSFDRLIADVYDSDENLHTILVQLGFQQQQIELLLGKHQEQIDRGRTGPSGAGRAVRP